jgi:hypothetical protein
VKHFRENPIRGDCEHGFASVYRPVFAVWESISCPKLCNPSCFTSSSVASSRPRSRDFQGSRQGRDRGIVSNYATAYAAWKSKAQQTVDNAHMRYFIVHLHRLLDPGQDTKSLHLKAALRKIGPRELAAACRGFHRG